MALENFQDSILLIITSYIDEEDIKTLSLTSKNLKIKVSSNLSIQNRLLIYEFKIAKSIISEVKRDPYTLSQGFMSSKVIKNGMLINKESDSLSEVQKIYTSTAYRLHNELYINKQFKLHLEQRRKLENEAKSWLQIQINEIALRKKCAIKSDQGFVEFDIGNCVRQ